MAYTVLARRYRSANFDEVIGQEHIAQTLKKAIESGRIAHAYLFCGTRGTGKTSTARILAKALNCRKFDAPTPVPCGECDSCLAIARGEDLDVIEIDAASNTGVDNVREIIENSQYRPARSRFKIYIIDEVHMLSKSAFNALLKTLEEPPSHVKFILATTEPEKVLPTILSRCQRYDFRNIPTREIAAHLKEICKKEKIKADDDALALVAKAGAGSMRDALSLLDRLLSIGEKTLSTATIEQMLGLPRAQLVFDLAQAIGAGDVKQALSQADAMITGGLSPDALIAALIDHLRNLLIARTCGIDSGLVDIPGLAIADLAKQAEQFDPIALAQDITILEELRRNLRQNQTGRALLDATLVRLALAGQFASIADLLAGMGSGNAGASAAQKKKPEPVRGAASVVARAMAAVSPGANAGAGAGAMAPGGRASDARASDTRASDARASCSTTPAGATPASMTAAAPTPVAASIPASIATSIAPTQSITTSPASTAIAEIDVAPAATAIADSQADDEDDDDDLPRPGKVFSGPSLAEMMRQHSATAVAALPMKPTIASNAPSAKTIMAAKSPAPIMLETPAPADESSVVPIEDEDVVRLWPQLLSLLEQQGSPLTGVLGQARLDRIDDGVAIIRFRPDQSTFAKTWANNGKKDSIAKTLSEVRGKPIGVRFEVDEEIASANAPLPRNATPPAGARPNGDYPTAPTLTAQPTSPNAPSAPTYQPPIPAASQRPSQELLDEVRADPLVQLVLREFGGTIIKVE